MNRAIAKINARIKDNNGAKDIESMIDNGKNTNENTYRGLEIKNV